MWDLDHKEGWVPKNWYFWTVMMEKTLESPFNCKEIKPINPKEINPEYSLKGPMLKLKLQYFGHLMWTADSLEKTMMLGKIKGRKRRGWQDEMVGWHHQLDAGESEQALGFGDRQGSLACCSPWGLQRVGHDWAIELNWIKEKWCIFSWDHYFLILSSKQAGCEQFKFILPVWVSIFALLPSPPFGVDAPLSLSQNDCCQALG